MARMRGAGGKFRSPAAGAGAQPAYAPGGKKPVRAGVGQVLKP
jgi:hypothetical protein